MSSQPLATRWQQRSGARAPTSSQPWTEPASPVGDAWAEAVISVRAVAGGLPANQCSMRSSVSSRVYVLGFNAFWCGNLVRLTVHGGWPPSPRLALLRVLGIALASSYTYRRLKVGFDADGATLVVRNLFRTRRIQQADVHRVWLGTPLSAPLPGGWQAGPRGEAINVETATHSITIDVSRNWLGRAGLHAQLVAAAAKLQAWQRQTMP